MTFSETFKALVVRQGADDTFTRAVEEKSVRDLPPGDLLIQVKWSSLNYKDALSASGNRGVTRRYPHTPGIDAAGTVVQGSAGGFNPGDPVIVTSYDLGMNTPGGFGGCIRVPAEWVVPLPSDMDLKTAMAYGTAGLTAALGVHFLLSDGLTPEAGEILVTGTTGGVGSIAAALLSGLGYRVAALNGRKDATAYLSQLGASTVVPRAEAVDTSSRPLLKGRWAGVFDAVGGPVLATALRSTAPHAVVTCCGNAAGGDLPMTVYPFILRGVTLKGIDSQNCPMSLRREIWKKLAGPWRVDCLEDLVREITLDGLDAAVQEMLQGKSPGRSIVRVTP